MKKALIIVGTIVLVLIVLVGGFMLLRPTPPKPPESVGSLDELDAYLNTLVGYNAGSPSAVSLVVVKDGEIVYAEGFGVVDPEGSTPAGPDTVYNQWSMTKTFTAVAIMQLQEQGLLDLDDPVTDYVPFFEVEYPSESSETITIRHLLNHSSGLSNNVPEIVGWVHTDGDPEWNQTELLREKFPDYAKLQSEPGTEAYYTNVGYMVLSAVIEAASGQSYESYVVENILQPLDMNLTGFNYSDEMIAHEATGTHPRIDIITPMLPFLLDNLDSLVREKADGQLRFNHVYSDQNGPTGLIGPPTDTARFLLAYLNGGELDGQRILSEESVAAMTNDSHVAAGKSAEDGGAEGVYRGLGWKVVEDGGSFYIQHSGGGPGFATNMRLYPDRDLGMVIMANGTYLDREGIFDLAASLDW